MPPAQEEKIYQLWKDLDAFKKQLAMTEGKPEYAPRRRSPLAYCEAHSPDGTPSVASTACVDAAWAWEESDRASSQTLVPTPGSSWCVARGHTQEPCMTSSV
jgi:hypothetical protein